MIIANRIGNNIAGESFIVPCFLKPVLCKKTGFLNDRTYENKQYSSE